MSCNISRFYYCEPEIAVKDFLKRDLLYKNGIAFFDIETPEADEFEKRLIADEVDYIRVDL